MMTFQNINLQKRAVAIVMDNHEFAEIIKHLVREKKDLQERLNVMEEILRSYLPIIGSHEYQNT